MRRCINAICIDVASTLMWHFKNVICIDVASTFMWRFLNVMCLLGSPLPPCCLLHFTLFPIHLAPDSPSHRYLSLLESDCFMSLPYKQGLSGKILITLGIKRYTTFFVTERKLVHIIGIKHGFSCINIRQVPREVSKTEAAVFNTSLGSWRMLMHWKTMFDRYYYIKTENICYISRYFLHYFVSPFHRCLANAICTDYARSRDGQYTFPNGSKSVAPVRSYWKLRSRVLTARELPC